ncbi:chemotaxis protein CheW [Heyndrickxia coagulans]|uniref:chemotaxis protein CheW n=1 Tax=Heyndrickxia coagulans TaxID=1398 RepID=UPI000CE29983|nr:chemotaxis protein CheW [Heyndrickxia coagulans]AVD56373.1 chemotaxis protein CheW [Heyndrickxia coagulans]
MRRKRDNRFLFKKGSDKLEALNKYIIFKTGEEEYGIHIGSVISVEKAQAANPVPKLPAFVRGIMKVRDELIPIIDVEHCFYQTPLSSIKDARMIVVRTEAIPVGLLVKEANDIVEIQEEEKKQIGLAGYGRTNYFTAVASLKDRLITIVDADLFTASLEGIADIAAYMKEAAENS